MVSFEGKRVIISGGSRGIGLAIAKRLAADGASIAILAKTTEPHPKLPGTIYTAAEEIEQAAQNALQAVARGSEFARVVGDRNRVRTHTPGCLTEARWPWASRVLPVF